MYIYIYVEKHHSFLYINLYDTSLHDGCSRYSSHKVCLDINFLMPNSIQLCSLMFL